MLSKHGRQWHDPQQPAAQRLQANIDALASANLISASRTELLLREAEAAGVPGLKRCNEQVNCKSFGKNTARAWKRRKLKHSHWPKHYYFQCRLWDPKTSSIKSEEICIDLPHEIVHLLVEQGQEDALLDNTFLDAIGKKHLDALKAKLGIDSLLGLGIHGDGVPCNYDRTESVFAISISLPGIGGKWQRMRIPIVVLPKSRICAETMYDVFEVIAWSLRHLLNGIWPSERHNGEPWREAASDKARKKRHGSLGIRAALVEVRGDWEFYSQVFGFPYHNEKDGICWRCPCRRDEVHRAESSAPWRSRRFTLTDFLERQMRKGCTINPIFAVSGITLEIFRIDWLHAVDLGVGADFLGNLLWMIAEKMPAPNQDSRVKLLQTEVNKYYAAHCIKDQSKKIIRLVAFYHCSYARGRGAEMMQTRDF